LSRLCSWLLILIGLFPFHAQAALFFAASTGWHVFSFQPEQEEITPNYYGIASQFNLGTSLSKRLDLSAFGAYVPGGAHIPKLGHEAARLIEYGGEISWQFLDAFVAIKGGPVAYIQRKSEEMKGEVAGNWHGAGGGLEVGGVQKTKYNQSWQISLAYFYILLQSPDQEQFASRHVHQIGLQARFTFGGLFKQFLQNTLFDHLF
jgi:hypothetical protein